MFECRTSALMAPAENETIRVPDHPKIKNTRRNQLPLTALAVALCLIVGYMVWRYSIPPAPMLFAQPQAAVTDAVWNDGAWYWIEGAGTPAARLVRAVGPAVTALVSGEQVRSFAVGEGKVAWIAGEGRRWSISTVPLDGSGKQTVWSGEKEPRGLCLADRRIYWLEQVPALIPGLGPLPPLESTIRVVAMPLEGGTLASIGSVMELRGDQIAGVRDGQVYVVASRPTLQNATTIYRVPISGGVARRVVGETGAQHALLTRNGTLYWTAPSMEAAQVNTIACIRRLGRDDLPVTLEDWVPGGGNLYESTGGTYYVDGSFRPLAWRVTEGKALPQSSPLPVGYTVVAVGDREMLLQSEDMGSKSPLYKIALP